MKFQNSKIIIIVISFVMIAGCKILTSHTSSVAPDKVVLNEDPNDFRHAYDKANKECKKGDRKTVYIPDTTANLDQFTFECVAEEQEVVAEGENDEEANASTDDNSSIESETVTEEISTEESESLETEVGSTDEDHELDGDDDELLEMETEETTTE
jgi:hypothetical protein